MASGATDPVLAKRARIQARVDLGKRVGYGLYAAAVLGFVAGAIRGFSDFLVTAIVAAMTVGAVLLIPAIVFGYGVKAAERDEREQAARAQATRGDEAR